MKDLRKIIALFVLIFVVGTIITLLSINHKLDQPSSKEKTVISKDSTLSESKEKTTV